MVRITKQCRGRNSAKYGLKWGKKQDYNDAVIIFAVFLSSATATWSEYKQRVPGCSGTQQSLMLAPLIFKLQHGTSSFSHHFSFCLFSRQKVKTISQLALLNDHYCSISRLLLAFDPLMKQMPFPDTNYGKQNKQKQTLKPIIIRPLMQTRWREAGAYQLLEVITKIQTIFHPTGSLCISVCFV